MNRARNNTQPNDEDLIGVLTAISVVSKRLANKLIQLEQTNQSMKGEDNHEQNKRSGSDNQRVKGRIATGTHGIRFICQSGMLFITLPSGRRLSYVKPRIGENKFGGESVTYEGIGGTKKWERIESYGPKFVENIVQAVSRDILCYAMRTLRNYRICGHVHDELIIECPLDTNVSEICEMMGRTPPWAKGLPLRADGYECYFYKKD